MELKYRQLINVEALRTIAEPILAMGLPVPQFSLAAPVLSLTLLAQPLRKQVVLVRCARLPGRYIEIVSR
ncbi:hypothetical protein Tco_1263325 [Tanacetum coccineum]